jgi:hypothetical protein
VNPFLLFLSSAWNLLTFFSCIRFCLEHGIQPDGTKPVDPNQKKPDDMGFTTFFTETNAGKYVKKNILICFDF